MQPINSSEAPERSLAEGAPQPETAHKPACVSVAGHEMTLFAESPPLIEAMIADIRAARARVWMESYIFSDDAAGQAVIAAMADRVQPAWKCG
jgi:phosphatidylserine/phosphatidylglycerophosphate/cardiolipin synthase-like enzyme